MGEASDKKDHLRNKQEYYAGLDSPTASEDDGTPDPGRHESIHAMQKAIVRKQATAATKGNNKNGSLPRSISDTSLTTKNQRKEPVNVAGHPPLIPHNAGKLPPSLLNRHTFSGTTTGLGANLVPSPTAASSTLGKRKRDTDVRQVPNENQTFKGLHFYFFPNSDKHPARKMRIAKAVKYGATWQKTFDDNVTHVIVDKGMTYALLTSFLKRDKLPPSVVVVSENYPADCISYRALLDPKQLQFRVKGYEIPLGARPVSAGSDTSLQLKPAGKDVAARQPETQRSGRRTPTSPAVLALQVHNEADAVPPPGSHHEKPTASVVGVQSTKEFDAVIQQARDLHHVPLDNDEEAASRPTSSEGPGTDDEQPRSDLTLLKKRKSKFQNWQDKFQCMQKHTGSKTETPNAATVAILEQMADYYGQMGDEWRIRAYRKAIATLRNHPKKVWTKEEALALPQIGERLATKIEEIAFTNRLRRLESARAEPSDQVLQTFMQVYGAGYAQASKWVSAGYTTLDELVQKAILTDNQRIGVDHYEDFNSRIPRAEVEQHGNIVKKTLQKIDPAFEVIVGGSYRRGSDTSGDIDCIITRPDTGSAHIRQVVLDQLVPKLFGMGFLVAELAATSRDDGSKWHGASQIQSSDPRAVPKPWRRIDLLLVPSDELVRIDPWRGSFECLGHMLTLPPKGAALIYFTGNDIFNRSVRLLASTKGMRLNQRGLYKDVVRGKGREKLSEGILIEGKDEKRIFEILGVPYRPPEHRIC